MVVRRKNLVVKDNALINASYHLDLVEQRLILLSIIEARATGKGITSSDKLTITASSYMNNFGVERDAAYKALKGACNNLFKRQFSFIEHTDKGSKVIHTRWVSSIAYIENAATIELIFAPYVAPLITLLEKNFTSYELEQIADLNSKYAIRLYEMTIAWKYVGKTPIFTIDELRDRLGVLVSEYKRMELFKRKVLDFAIKLINDKTNISIYYEQCKSGRKIIGFNFFICPKIRKVKKLKVIEQAQVKEEKIKEREEDEQRKKEVMIAKFENLSSYEQENILDEVAKHIDGPFYNLFKQVRSQGEAHRNGLFIHWFLEILDC
mgnify:CR=1 FL=1